MINIVTTPTTVWSTGFNGSINIKNNSNVNYGSNWNISCVLSPNSSITWCDFMKITTNGNIVTLSPQSWTNSLSSITTISGNFGGLGTIPNTFTFNSSIQPQPIPPTPTPPPKPTPPTPPPTPIPTPIPKPIPSPPTPQPDKNSQKRVVYLGYWISDSDVSRIVSELKSANITHALLTFILQPDYTKPLTIQGSMIEAFKSLTPNNQKLLTNSGFKLGVSVYGALKVPVPFSLAFCRTDSYYYNNPAKFSQDIFNFVKGTGLENYIDLDIEHIDDKFTESATFLGEVCKELKRLNLNCDISHAPQPPYFCSNYGNIYDLIYKNYRQYFNFLNIQYYNNGSCKNFEEIFIKSFTNVAPSTSVLELINKGYISSYLVVGKTIQGESDSSNGYIPLQEMTSIVKQAYNTPSLKEWNKTGGLMIWYYNTQGQNGENNKTLLNYFQNIS